MKNFNLKVSTICILKLNQITTKKCFYYMHIWPIEMRNEHQNLDKEQVNYCVVYFIQRKKKKKKKITVGLVD
jgi:hypothetical protein